MYPDLKEKVVIVTGSGAGIGRGVALRFGCEESFVVVNDLRAEAAKKVTMEIESAGGVSLSIPGDMTNESEVNKMFDQVTETYGRVDILVYNVGLFEFSELVGSSIEGWNKDFDVNLKSAYLCSNRAAQEMKKVGQGRIINTSSGAGKIGGTWSRGYGASKWAVLGLTKSLAAELAPNIRVNAVCPGIIETEMDEKKERVDDALNATKAALEEGIVPGGGAALIYASETLNHNDDSKSQDFSLGIDLVKKAC